MPEIKPTRVFTKDAPCTKVDLWNAFISPNGLRPLSVVASRGEIGLNAPKYLLKNEYLERYEEKGVDYYRWTDKGEAWLRKGLAGHLERHPADVPLTQHYLQLLVQKKPRPRVTRRVPT